MKSSGILPANLQGPLLDTNDGMGSRDGCVSTYTYDGKPCDCTSSNWNTLSYAINQWEVTTSAMHSISTPTQLCLKYPWTEGTSCTKCSLDGSHSPTVQHRHCRQGVINTGTGFVTALPMLSTVKLTLLLNSILLYGPMIVPKRIMIIWQPIWWELRWRA